MAAGRPADAGRRDRVLTAVTDHVLRHGLTGLSLRPLAEALGTSPRMLLYDFGSKDLLVADVLAEVRRRQADLVAAHYSGRASSQTAVRALWEWLIDPGHAGYVRLYAEAQVARALGRRATPPTQPGNDDFREKVEASRADIVVISTLLHALALRRLADDDPAVVDATFEHFLGVVRA